MNFANLLSQGVDLEMAKGRLDSVVEDIERLKVLIVELLDDTDVELREGSRFRKLLIIKSLLASAGIDAYSSLRSVKSALSYQQDSLPQPEDVA
jgi:hypothetical protein